MFLTKEVDYIKEKIFALVGFAEKVEVVAKKSQELTIEYDGGTATIGCADKSMFARGVFLLTKKIKEGKCPVNIRQKRYFTECGVMLPVCRGAVMKVESIKRYIDNLAALGLNMMMLYMEDTYELEGYPYFGYLRGRYSLADLKEIDDYAYSMGIEVIPCIQTLAHLYEYLRWPEAAPIKDTDISLMVGEEKTYEFIECIIKTMKAAFRTNQIHLGMDEAHSMGFGAYYIKHGLPNRKQMFMDHIARIKELCSKYSLKPIIWSDMIFRVCGGHTDEYAPEAVVTEDIIHAIQGLELVYWDYYKTEQNKYDQLIKRHHTISKDVMFAGGVWTWDGFLLNTRYTFDTAMPGLRAAIDNKVKHVLATSWGGDAEDFQDFYSLAIYSEMMYRGAYCTEDEICEIAEYLTGLSKEVVFAMSEFHLGYEGAVSIGKRFIYCDLLYPIFRYEIDFMEAKERYQKALNIIEKDSSEAYEEFKRYATVLLKICVEKSDILNSLREQYKDGNRAYLHETAEVKIPVLLELYEQLEAIHEEIWLKDHKPFGIENLQFEYGGIIRRLKYVRRTLNAFLCGELDTIEELDVAVNKCDNSTWLSRREYMSTSLITLL